LYILWGIISTALSIFLEFILQQIPYPIHNRSLAFIIPAGGFMEGALCTVGIFLYLKMKSLRVKPKHFVFGALMAFAGFWAVYYMGYQTSYVYKDSLNHSFQGEKLTNYIYDDMSSVTFHDYLNLVIENTSFKSVAYVGASAEIDNFGFNFNIIVFISECIGFCLGGASIGLIALNNRESCKKCKSLFHYKKLYAFDPELMKDEINEIQNSFNTKGEFKAFVYKNRVSLKADEAYVDVFFKYCSTCNIGYIEYRYMQPKNKLAAEIVWTEDEDEYMQIHLPSDKLKIVNKTSI
jgi:hypothetical protein